MNPRADALNRGGLGSSFPAIARLRMNVSNAISAASIANQITVSIWTSHAAAFPTRASKKRQEIEGGDVDVIPRILLHRVVGEVPTDSFFPG